MKKQILIVDDDEELCEEISEILRDNSYAVTVIYNGFKGNELSKKIHFDVILLDIKMPGMEGYDLLKNIKEDKPEAKVIVLTGKPLFRSTGGLVGCPSIDGDEKKIEILKLADCVLNKPFDIRMILEKIEEFTGKTSVKMPQKIFSLIHLC